MPEKSRPKPRKKWATWPPEWRPFVRARAFVRKLGLKNSHEWYLYRRGELRRTHGLRPEDIPCAPETVYWDHWRGLGDWLGTGRIANQKRRHLPFRQARAFVRALKLESVAQWERWCKGGMPEKGPRPDDIPSVPARVYRDKGWKGYGDWLGTGTLAPKDRRYRPFEAARAFVHALGLTGKGEWAAYGKGKLARVRTKRPADIPSDPRQVYSDRWRGWGDWLGTGTIAPKDRRYRPFPEARAFARALGLASSSQWYAWSAGRIPEKGMRPVDIPSAPWLAYAGEGWSGFGDWLGTGTIATFRMRFMSFEQARQFVRGLGLKSSGEWTRYCKGELPGHPGKPKEVPANPATVYGKQDWMGWGDWLGTGNPARGSIKWRPFTKARAFVRSLGLESSTQWHKWRRGERPDLPEFPKDIPSSPDITLRGLGWKGWGDWLGTGTEATARRRYRPFRQARAFARALGLTCEAQWRSFIRGEQPGKRKPPDIPAAPNWVYLERGWAGWGDFLGTGRSRRSAGPFRSFEGAKAFAASLGLRGQKEWSAYCRGRMPEKGERPGDIPSHPEAIYAKQGWSGWGDFLGTGNPSPKGRKWRPFEEARAFARSLHLSGSVQWADYCAGRLPDLPPRPRDIPAHPEHVYREKGWIGYRGWLRPVDNYAVTRRMSSRERGGPSSPPG